MTAIAETHPRAGEPHVPVYVWDLVVRITHWTIAITIIVLSVTGIYIGRPFLVVSGPAGERFVTGIVKAIHSYSAIAFTLAVLTRVLWMFVGKSHYARWTNFIPVSKDRWRGLWRTFEFYIFALRKPPSYVGHNPLSGLAYSAVFFLYFVQIATGFALYSASSGVNSPMRVFTFLIPIVGGLQTAHWIHHVVMWLLLGFAVHHVYSAVYMSTVEANATVESIFSGQKFVPPEEVGHR